MAAFFGGAGDHVREARVDREPDETPAARRDAPVRVEGLKRDEKRLRHAPRGLGRLRHPRERRPRRDAPVRGLQAERRKVGVENLGERLGLERRVRGEVPEPVAGTRTEASGTAPALVGAVARHAQRLEARHAVADGKARHPHPACVNDDADVADREARLRDGRGENHLAAPLWRRLDGGVLLLARERAVEREDIDVGRKAHPAKRFRRAPYLPFPRQKSQNAALLLADDGIDGVRDGFVDWRHTRRP